MGAEPALKAELAREHPELHFAYSRPGFLTFKSKAPLNPETELRSVFARAYGVSLGKLTLLADLLAEIRQLSQAQDGGKWRLHLWERDRHSPGEEPLGFEHGKQAALLEASLRKECGELFLTGSVASSGDHVLDLVWVEENEWWLGWHPHLAAHSPFPGGRPRIALPPEAPSRAYLKLEDGLLWSAAPLRAGDVAVEIGSAPGGSSYALLNRGLKVVGIDPAEMDPRVLAMPGFTHFPKPVGTILREDLPASIQWLLLDMNVAPNISLFAVDRLASRMQESLLGVMLTIKLNEWKLASEIPGMLDHIKAMGMTRLRATQLASNRQEIFVFGMTRKGVLRGHK